MPLFPNGMGEPVITTTSTPTCPSKVTGRRIGLELAATGVGNIDRANTGTKRSNNSVVVLVVCKSFYLVL